MITILGTLVDMAIEQPGTEVRAQRLPLVHTTGLTLRLAATLVAQPAYRLDVMGCTDINKHMQCTT